MLSVIFLELTFSPHYYSSHPSTCKFHPPSLLKSECTLSSPLPFPFSKRSSQSIPVLFNTMYSMLSVSLSNKDHNLIFIFAYCTCTVPIDQALQIMFYGISSVLQMTKRHVGWKFLGWQHVNWNAIMFHKLQKNTDKKMSAINKLLPIPPVSVILQMWQRT